MGLAPFSAGGFEFAGLFASTGETVGVVAFKALSGLTAAVSAGIEDSVGLFSGLIIGYRF